MINGQEFVCIRFHIIILKQYKTKCNYPFGGVILSILFMIISGICYSFKGTWTAFVGNSSVSDIMLTVIRLTYSVLVSGTILLFKKPDMSLTKKTNWHLYCIWNFWRGINYMSYVNGGTADIFRICDHVQLCLSNTYFISIASTV